MIFDMVYQKENEDELRAEEWFKKNGYSDIRKPVLDPPDFLVDDRYAVEVTRLNQRIASADGSVQRGEEERRIPLERHIQKVIDNLGSPGNEGSIWIIDCEYDFSKELPKPNVVKKQVSEVLSPLTKSYESNVIEEIMYRSHFDRDKHAGELSGIQHPHICLQCGICMELTERSGTTSKFILQNVSDGMGIGVAEELAKGIQHRISDKSDKIRRQNKVGCFEEWWLFLIDHIGHFPIGSLSRDEQNFVQNQDPHFWSRIVIISLAELNWHYELFPGDRDQRDTHFHR